MSLKIKQIDGLQVDLDAKLESVDLSYTPATRTIGNTGGNDVVLPLFTSTDAGLVPLSGGGTTNFLRADGTWAAAGADGNGIYDSSGSLSAATTVTLSDESTFSHNLILATDQRTNAVNGKVSIGDGTVNATGNYDLIVSGSHGISGVFKTYYPLFMRNTSAFGTAGFIIGNDRTGTNNVNGTYRVYVGGSSYGSIINDCCLTTTYQLKNNQFYVNRGGIAHADVETFGFRYLASGADDPSITPTLVMDTSSRVGIGMQASSVAAKLHVDGTTRLDGVLSVNKSSVIGTDALTVGGTSNSNSSTIATFTDLNGNVAFQVGRSGAAFGFGVAYDSSITLGVKARTGTTTALRVQHSDASMAMEFQGRSTGQELRISTVHGGGGLDGTRVGLGTSLQNGVVLKLQPRNNETALIINNSVGAVKMQFRESLSGALMHFNFQFPEYANQAAAGLAGLGTGDLFVETTSGDRRVLSKS
jgi:hypothetical protein